MSESLAHLAALKRRFEPLRPPGAAEDLFALGAECADQALGGGLARGRVHEIFAGESDDASGAAGFALMLALRARRRPGQLLLWLRTEAAERRSGRLHAPGLAELGLDPDGFVLGVMPDELALLKSAADAVRCADLGAVMIECWGHPRALDLTASRRLSVAAQKSGVTALMLRLDAKPEPSAAETRWAVHPAASRALEANAPGQTMIEVEILRRRAGPAGMRWRLEWDRDEQAFRDAALSGAVVPLPARRPAEAVPHVGWRLTA